MALLPSCPGNLERLRDPMSFSQNLVPLRYLNISSLSFIGLNALSSGDVSSGFNYLTYSTCGFLRSNTAASIPKTFGNLKVI